jgi:predicted ester cyclase
VLGAAVTAAPQGGAFAGRIADPVTAGISGPRPPHHQGLCEMVRDYFEDVWNRRRFDLAPRYVSDRIVCHGVRMRRVQNLTPYQLEIINLLATFPDGQIELRDIAVCDGPELGLRVGVIWVLRGTYSGVPTYGPTTDTPIHVLAASQFEIHEGRILREWRIYDEVAVLTQIMAARG